MISSSRKLKGSRKFGGVLKLPVLLSLPECSFRLDRCFYNHFFNMIKIDPKGASVIEFFRTLGSVWLVQSCASWSKLMVLMSWVTASLGFVCFCNYSVTAECRVIYRNPGEGEWKLLFVSLEVETLLLFSAMAENAIIDFLLFDFYC